MLSSIERLSRQRITVTAAILACGLAGVGLGACAGGEGVEDAGDADEVLATIDGSPVTMADIDEQIGERLEQLEYQYRSQRHDLIESTLQSVVRDRLLEGEAAARGITKDELVANEIDARVQVTESEITNWYNANQARLGGRSLEQLYPRIREFLESSKRDQILERFTNDLAGDKEISFFLEPFRVVLNNEGSPALGPADAPVTVVEFSDFECPFCRRFKPIVHELRENYGDQVRIVYRQYPLDIHPRAFKAAEAALCAHEQDKFWDMHDLLFDEQDSLDVESLKEKAGRLGLAQAEFDSCLDSGRHAERIRRDLQEGAAVGVDGTPAIFVNGVPVPGGAVPYATLAAYIDAELAREGSE
ncbi:MAG: thioredoxin domain-containing protein [Gemmatimonadota bacterium]|nr:MAG: thioredoxin domain-containing protein [Gemmatimonadota bacterium]